MSLRRIGFDRGRQTGLKQYAGQVLARIATPAGIGKMSAQRRGNRPYPATTNCRQEVRCRSQRVPCTASTGAWAPRVQNGACADGETAPPGYRVWLATNSLQSDHRRCSSPFDRALRRNIGLKTRCGTHRPAAHLTPEPPRPSFPPCSQSSRLLPHLSGIPAGVFRRAERYDGKRDMHLLHAA